MNLRLIDTVTTPTNFIFTALDELDIPWKEEDIASELDLYYLANISGEKQISNIVKLLADTVTHKLSTESVTILADTIYAMYNKKWEKLYNTYSLEYNPISNYDMTEEMTDDVTEKTGRENITVNRDGENTIQKGTTEELTNDLLSTDNYNKTSEREVSAFNSDDFVPSEKITENTEDATKADTGTQTTTYTGTDTYNTDETDQTMRGYSDTNTRNYTLTRSGNIGVTTSQQMIESERKLWQWEFFNDVVFPDIDHALTIPYYGGV